MSQVKPLSEREARSFSKRKPHIALVGWLMAASAPSNLAKGKTLFFKLPVREQYQAKRYRDHCTATYPGGTS